MSYLKKIEYEIVPEESFQVIRNCSGCGRKTVFRNTERFRVNANGNKLDVWLIYHCENCKHTFNLTVYERQKPSSVPKEEYQRFLCNDEELAKVYGTNLQFFRKNKAEVDFQNIKYSFVKKKVEENSDALASKSHIMIQNPCGLKIRPERQIAEVLAISRSQVQKLMEQGKIETEEVTQQFISIYADFSELTQA